MDGADGMKGEDGMGTIELLRRHYAEGLAWEAGLAPGPIVEAFARVPRERFLGPGPWPIMGRGGYRSTPDDDPRHLYHDVLVGLQPERRLNNGKPSFLATLIYATGMAEGEHVVHLGCGVGYYSAVMAEIVGENGHVTAVEADAELAARAVECLSDRPNVDARHGDGTEVDFEPADVIFVNFGMTHPLPRWVERLKPGGRLLVAITAASGVGAMLRFDPGDDGSIAARLVSPTQIFSSVSARDPKLQRTLTEHFAGNPMAAAAVASLRLDEHAEDDTCWLHGPGVCLSRRTVGPTSPLDVYAGIFSIAPGTDVVFRVRDDALHVQSPAGGAELVQRADDHFEAPRLASMHFHRDEEGRVTSVTIQMGEQTFEARRAG